MADANDELWDAIIECCPAIVNTDARADTVFMGFCQVLRQTNNFTSQMIRQAAAMANVVLPAVSTTIPQLDSTFGDSLHTWRSDFKGSFDLPLLQTIREAAAEPVEEDGTFLYSRQLAIIQSSGTGKSRLVNQVSKTLFTVPICLREVHSTGFPPRDGLVCEYFTNVLPATIEDANKRCNAFFLSLLIILSKTLESPDFATPQKLWQAFEDGMTLRQHGAFRIAFHAKVVSLARELDKNGVWRRERVQEQWYDQICTHNGKQLSMGDMSEQVCGKIKQLVPPTVQSKKMDILLISIDEGHYFNLADFRIQGKSYFSHVRQSLSFLVHQPIVIPVTSTAAGIKAVFPLSYSGMSGASAKDRDLSARFLKPYTAVGWDVMQEMPRFNTVDTLNQLKTMKCFGRPLFGVWNEGDTEEMRARSLLEFARQKLLLDPHRPLNDEQYFALAGSQISLESRPERWIAQSSSNTFNSHQERQVMNHLAILVKLDSDNNVSNLLRPAEPLLGLAAAWVLLDRCQSPNVPLLRFYMTVCDICNSDARDRSKILAMIVCLEAYKYVHGVIPSNDSLTSVFRLLQPVKLSSYLCKLTSSALVQEFEILQKANHPQYTTNQPVLRIIQFKETWLQFDSVTPITLLQSFVRGIAVKGCQQQYAVDLIIPLLFGDKVDEVHMGAIFIQVKNDKPFGPSMVKKAFEKMDQLRKKVWPAGSPLPTIQIVFSFGTDFKPSTIHFNNASNSYCIQIHGHTMDTFPSFIQPLFGSNKLLAHILRSSTPPTPGMLEAAMHRFMMPCLEEEAQFVEQSDVEDADSDQGVSL